MAYSAIKIAVALAPAIFSMFLLYWLETNEVWVPQTPHRDKMTIAILVVGLIMSFFAQSYLSRGKKK